MQCALSTTDVIALRARADLVVSVQKQHRQTIYVLKDPLSLRYFRLEDFEYAIFQMLTGQASVSAIVEKLAREFPHALMGAEDVRSFVTSLYRQSLVIGERPGQGMALKKRSDKTRHTKRQAIFRNILAIRCPGFDPTWLLDRIYPITAWFFSLPALLAVISLAIAALGVLAVHITRLPSELVAMGQYFGPGNWLLLALTLAVTKVLHEFGHALACRRFDGECHEIGVMLLVLTPCLYCDVSDSWLLPNRWHRAAIAAAGMYVEVTLASLAVLVWSHSEPGTLHFLALQVMLICGASTLLFNGNPLARYDGYYILADLTDTPNLRDQARTAVSDLLWRLLLGVDNSDGKRTSWKLVLFGIGVTLYRWILLCVISWFLYHALAAQGLEVAWQLMFASVLFAVVITPLWRLGKKLLSQEVRSQMKRRHVIVTSILAASACAFVLLVPLPSYVHSPCEIRPANAAPIYAPHAARLMQLKIELGQQVTKGQHLATLQNLDHQIDVSRLESAVRLQELLLESLKYQRFDNEHAGAAVPQAEELLAATVQQMQQRQADLAQFTLTAPRDGVVLVSERRQRAADKATLSGWSGSPLDARNAGASLVQGDVICEVGDARELEAVLIVDQSSVEALECGQQVRIALDADPWNAAGGEICEIARQKLDATPKSLSVQAGGGIASRVDEQGIERPVSASYTVRVPLVMESAELMPGMRGTARIRTGWQTLGQRMWRTLCRIFHFGL